MAHTVTALTRLPGLHFWPGAPQARSYLGHPHRHLFHVRATVAVDHGDRDVEFHDLGAMIQIALVSMSDPYEHDHTLRDFGGLSCEDIAYTVGCSLAADGLHLLRVTCAEDDEYTAEWMAAL